MIRLSSVVAGLALAAAFCSAASAATTANAESPLGVNLNRVSYYDPEQPFLNIFKTTGATQATPTGWYTLNAQMGQTNEATYLQLDANGYPTTLTASSADPNSPQKFSQACVLILDLSPSNGGTGLPYQAGQYVILYDGVGTLQVGLDGRMVSTSQGASGGRDVFNVANPRNGVWVCITRTDHSNYVRNIRVVKAEYESLLDKGNIFSPIFLGLLQNFRVLRTIQWLGIDDNPSPPGDWADRPHLSDAGWGSNSGVPLETVISLCNALSSDCWINVPDTADDNYITQMATLVHQELGSTQKAYVEFSNEVWNPAYLQYGYASSQGLASWPNNANKFTANRNWYGMRVAQMCDIWAQVWGEDFSRVHCILAAQAANTWTATEALACPLWSGSPCYKHHITDVAIAPYFGWVPQQTPADWNELSVSADVGDIFAALNGPSAVLNLTSSINDRPEGAVQQVSDWEIAYKKALVAYNLPMVAYEGGQSLVGSPIYKTGSTIVNAFIAANRSAEMAAAYTTALSDWKANGGRTYILYDDITTPSQYGEWGLLESFMDTVNPLSNAPPKWRAVQNFIAKNPCWWSGCVGETAAVPLAPSGLKESTNH